MEPPKAVSEQLARWAIDGAILKGRMGESAPPETDHWLMQYWLIGQQLAKLGETGIDNVNPPDDAKPAPIQHDSDCSTNNHGVPELLGPCDCSKKDPATHSGLQSAMHEYSDAWTAYSNSVGSTEASIADDHKSEVRFAAAGTAVYAALGAPGALAAQEQASTTPLEAIEHGQLKRAAFADDLAYSIYLSERRDAPPVTQEQAKQTDLLHVKMTLECGNAKQTILLSRYALAQSKVPIIGLHAERILEDIERHLTATHGESETKPARSV
jgi:hypothetical protein